MHIQCNAKLLSSKWKKKKKSPLNRELCNAYMGCVYQVPLKFRLNNKYNSNTTLIESTTTISCLHHIVVQCGFIPVSLFLFHLNKVQNIDSIYFANIFEHLNIVIISFCFGDGINIMKNEWFSIFFQFVVLFLELYLFR